MDTPQEHYRQSGMMTRAEERTDELRALPPNLEALCKVVQGALIHRDLAAPLYGLSLSAGNMIRDLAGLNRMEMLPWDVWGMMRGSDERLRVPPLVFNVERNAPENIGI
jgi:hypothetical protein